MIKLEFSQKKQARLAMLRIIKQKKNRRIGIKISNLKFAKNLHLVEKISRNYNAELEYNILISGRVDGSK